MASSPHLTTTLSTWTHSALDLLQGNMSFFSLQRAVWRSSLVTKSSLVDISTNTPVPFETDILNTTIFELTTSTFPTTILPTTPVPSYVRSNLTKETVDFFCILQIEDWCYITILLVLAVILCSVGGYYFITNLIHCKTYCLKRRGKPVSVQSRPLPTSPITPLIQESISHSWGPTVSVRSPPTLSLRPVLR